MYLPTKDDPAVYVTPEEYEVMKRNFNRPENQVDRLVNGSLTVILGVPVRVIDGE